MNKKESIAAYYQLRTKLDERCDELNQQHSKHLQCKAGCDSCCENISVFPLEFEAIKLELGDSLKSHSLNRPFNRFRKSCVFLVDSKCSIYNSRPFICRTQGLPLLYQSNDGSGYELSVCHLNFKGVDVNIFNSENALFMPEFNSKLFLNNQEYLGEGNKLSKKRIPLYRLLK